MDNQALSLSKMYQTGKVHSFQRILKGLLKMRRSSRLSKRKRGLSSSVKKSKIMQRTKDIYVGEKHGESGEQDGKIKDGNVEGQHTQDVPRHDDLRKQRLIKCKYSCEECHKSFDKDINLRRHRLLSLVCRNKIIKKNVNNNKNNRNDESMQNLDEENHKIAHADSNESIHSSEIEEDVHIKVEPEENSKRKTKEFKRKLNSRFDTAGVNKVNENTDLSEQSEIENNDAFFLKREITTKMHNISIKFHKVEQKERDNKWLYPTTSNLNGTNMVRIEKDKHEHHVENIFEHLINEEENSFESGKDVHIKVEPEENSKKKTSKIKEELNLDFDTTNVNKGNQNTDISIQPEIENGITDDMLPLKREITSKMYNISRKVPKTEQREREKRDQKLLYPSRENLKGIKKAALRKNMFKHNGENISEHVMNKSVVAYDIGKDEHHGVKQKLGLKRKINNGERMFKKKGHPPGMKQFDENAPLLSELGNENYFYKIDDFLNREIRNTKYNMYTESANTHPKENETQNSKIHKSTDYLDCVNEEEFMKEIYEHYIENVHDHLICNLCDEPFANSCVLKIHLESHTELRSYFCRSCKLTFKLEQDLVLHLQNHELYGNNKCYLCWNLFWSESDLEKHLQCHFAKAHVACPVCEKTVFQEDELQDHFAIHIKEGCLFCKECEAYFLDINDLEEHEQSHSPLMLYSCFVCGVQMNEKNLLEKHYETHKDINIFTCGTCPKIFTNENDLFNHKQTHKNRPTKRITFHLSS